ncbi:MAG: MFS transporter [Clostridia bacterium]|nr:MFS transporter [Clostridia bacterium]
MKNYNLLKKACYISSVTMSIVGNISPILFLTFRNLYGLSFSQLGLLIVINFCSQLGIDLVFSFFSHKFNIAKVVRFTPLITTTGLLLFTVLPTLFPDFVYGGMIISTSVFSIAAGFNEVLLSPVIASIPSEYPEREMSKLHSAYAWGVVGVVIFATLFLSVVGYSNWQWLIAILTLVPITAAFMFMKAEIPALKTEQSSSGKAIFGKQLIVCFMCMFFAGASELTMAQWSSSFLEKVTGIPKVVGDIVGVALFSATLGLGRSLYGKYGKNIRKVLLWSSVFSTVLYFLMATTNNGVINLVACIMTGLAVSMLWPGTLLIAADDIPDGGVVMYAIMAAGGDLGASVGPEVVGIVADLVLESNMALNFAAQHGFTHEQISMKAGMLVAVLFPLLATILFVIKRKKRV